MNDKSRLQKVLESGQFAVTAECGPPRGADKDVIIQKGNLLKGHVDAVNVTDNQTAIVRMSSIAASAHLVGLGLEPIMQMVTRDRNRIALQSDLMGAYSLGIRNILCLTGDHQTFGSQPEAMNVFDIDSMNLLQMVSGMGETGKDMSGYDLAVAPQMFVGAAANPFADPLAFRVIRLEKKAAAGARFIQTQCIYNLPRFREWMCLVRDAGLDEQVYILGGVTPLKSAGMASYMASKVAGMDIPQDVIDRMKGAAKGKAAEEGLKICQETIQELKEMKGISGVHIMAIENEAAVPGIVAAAGLASRPEVA